MDWEDKERDHGKCGQCGALLAPVMFREKECRVVDGTMMFTGRTRMAVSHLICPFCGREYAVDDSFDGEWED